MKCNIPNSKCQPLTPEEESAKREADFCELIKVLANHWAALSSLFGDIKDPRKQHLITYSLKQLLIYGIMIFILRCSSKRDANRLLSNPIVVENMRKIFPELAEAPHCDTLSNLLEEIDPEDIQKAYSRFIKKLIRRKEFQALVGDTFTILVDGSGKYSRDWEFSTQAIKKEHKDGSITYESYVLATTLVLKNGMVIPLSTVFIENEENYKKQDCEIKAWERIVPKIKAIIGTRNAVFCFDSLYVNGKVFTTCRDHGWDYIVNFKRGSAKSVYEDATGSLKLSDSIHREKDGRTQNITWVVGVEYTLSANHTIMPVNVVRLEESWVEDEKRKGKGSKHRSTTYMWITSLDIDAQNVMSIVDLGRSRWLCENQFKVEKHNGYGFEHLFSENWKAAKGFHYLMNFGYLFNILAISCELIHDKVMKHGGITGFLDYMKYIIFSAVWQIHPDTLIHFRVRYCTETIYRTS